MEISVTNIHSKWVECTNLPGMDYQVLSIDELVRECAEHPCAEAWEEFIRQCQPVIAKVALRACREWSVTAQDVVEDRVQDTFTKLFDDHCSLLRRFRPTHENSFLGYLKVVTANVVYDHFRAEHADRRDVGNTTELNEAVHHLQQEVGSMDSEELEIFLNEIDDLLRQRGNGPVEQRERAIFWLYYRHGLTAKEIASIPAIKLTVKGVESCIHRLTLYVKECLVMEKTPKG